MPPLRKEADQNTELSVDAIAFLDALFKQYKEDADNNGSGLLRDSRLEEIFEVTPENPWKADPRYNFPNGVEYIMVPVQTSNEKESSGNNGGTKVPKI